MSSSLSKQPYKGCRDFFPTQKREQDYLFSHMRQTAMLYAYEPYDGPMLELVDLYKAKSGEELINDQIYSFTDRGDRFVAIRPEMTPTVARMVAQIHKEAPKPIRWYSIPNLMRYEKPQKGRLREHWQFNCDIFGAPEVLGEIEILNVVKDLMTSFGANHEHFEILLNDRDIVTAVLDSLDLTEDQSYKLFKVIDKAKKVKKDALEKMINEAIGSNPEILSDYLKLKSFDELLKFVTTHNIANKTSRIQSFLEKTKGSDLESYLVYDPTIVRGLDYYTGIVFEVFDKHPDNRRALCGGGAYANLLQIFNEQPLAAVGFGLGDVTLTDFLRTHGLMPDFSKTHATLFVAYPHEDSIEEALRLSQVLRKNNVSTETSLQPLKFNKAFKIAQKKGYQYMLVLGETENQVSLKELESKRQVDIAIDKFEEEIKKLFN